MMVFSLLAQAVNSNSLPQPSLETTVPNLIRVVMAIVALLSVIFVILGAIKYSTSSGDPNGAAQAKATITYALIGLVVALLSFTIVSFVLGNL